jgi:alpha-tubulin suppressor-like RCC1 family protein
MQTFDFNVLLSDLPKRVKCKNIEPKKPVEHVTIKLDMSRLVKEQLHPTELLTMQNKRIIDISVGQDHCILLTDENGGSVYTCGNGFNGRLGHLSEDDVSDHQPQKIQKLTGIKQIAAGSDFSMFLRHTSDKHEVICCGSNVQGQLLISNSRSANVLQPTMVEWLYDMPVDPKIISAGYAHSIVVVTASNKDYVLSFGLNEHFQLGRDDNNQEHGFSIPFFNTLNQNISLVSCGDSHTIVQTKQGTIYAFGRCEYGQLGVGTSHHENIIQPTIVKHETAILNMSAGYRHSLFLSVGDRIYATGNNQFGQLGLLSQKTVVTPKRVQYLGAEHRSWKKEFGGIRQIATGDNFSVLLMNDSRVVYFKDDGEFNRCVQHVIKIPLLRHLTTQRIAVYGTNLYVYAVAHSVLSRNVEMCGLINALWRKHFSDLCIILE